MGRAVLRKLHNPFFLGFQGFVAGALLFWSTHPEAFDLPLSLGQPAPAEAPPQR
jgi:hypothetical protein